MCATSPPGSSKTRRDGIAPRIDAGIAAGELKVINLPHKIPVAWVYVTGWVTRDGTVNFRDDVYKHDDTLDRDALADARGRRLRRAGEGSAIAAARSQADIEFDSR